MRGITIATAALLLGVIVFCVAMTMIGWDFTRLSTRKMQTNEYEINDSFTNISVDADTARIVFLPSDNGKCKVVCYEEINAAHTVKVENGTLSISVNDEKTLMDHIGFNFSAPTVTVYMPEGEYGTLKIDSSTGDINVPKEFKLMSIDVSLSTGDVSCSASATESIKLVTSTGDINVANISAASLDLAVTTGRVRVSGAVCTGDISLTVSTGKSELSAIRCNNLTTTGSTGEIALDDVIVTEKLSVKRTTGDVELEDLTAGEMHIETSTGDVEIERSDADKIYIVTDTGDVEGTLRTEKIFIPRTDTGKIDVPKTTSGGICEITTSTGDIEIEIKGE